MADEKISELDDGAAVDGSEEIVAVQGGDNVRLTLLESQALVDKVYFHDGSAYELVGGRTFIGPEDPEDDGFTLTDGDQWIDTSA